MNSEEIVESLLAKTNFDTLSDKEANEFVKGYIKKLVLSILLYVDSKFTVGNIRFADSYDLTNEISQEITGLPSAYSAVDGEIRALVAFAEGYSSLGIAEYDELCKEVLQDFLNLHNGLFVVYLSENNINELSLSVPKSNGQKVITSPLHGKITIIPIDFTYGTVNFLLVEMI